MRRWKFLFFASIACGVILTILTSWASAFWLEYQPFTYDSVDIPSWVRRVPESWPSAPDEQTTHYQFSFGDCFRQMNMLQSLDSDFELYDYRYGWPMSAMSYQVTSRWNPVDGQVTQRMGWLSDGIPLPRHHPDRRLPLRPDAIPFAINTLFYACVTLSLVIGFTRFSQWMRSSLRASRGHCRKCGYTLAGLPSCPECNTPAPPRTITQ